MVSTLAYYPAADIHLQGDRAGNYLLVDNPLLVDHADSYLPAGSCLPVDHFGNHHPADIRLRVDSSIPAADCNPVVDYNPDRSSAEVVDNRLVGHTEAAADTTDDSAADTARSCSPGRTGPAAEVAGSYAVADRVSHIVRLVDFLRCGSLAEEE
jgi:hypothetical protein